MATAIPAGYELLSGPVTKDLVLTAFDRAKDRGFGEESVLAVSEGLLVPTGEDAPGIASQPDYEAVAARNSDNSGDVPGQPDTVEEVETPSFDANRSAPVTEANTHAEIDAWAEAHDITFTGQTTKADKLAHIAEVGENHTED